LSAIRAWRLHILGAVNSSRSRPAATRLLALDTGSPIVSVALAVDGAVVAERSIEQARSSVALLRMIDDALLAAGLGARDLTGLAVLRGPGSFTGMRVGMATAQGLHAALGMPVAVLPSLSVLAALAGQGNAGGQPSTVLGAVDALRDEWFVQPFRVVAGRAPEPLAEAVILPASRLGEFAPATVCGFGIARLVAAGFWPAGLVAREAAPLASTAAVLAPLYTNCWDAALLTQPLYLREPAVTLPAA
jgi:tRNA threonylcarbamoyladenosine biosynthesis protein TsaB